MIHRAMWPMCVVIAIDTGIALNWIIYQLIDTSP